MSEVLQAVPLGASLRVDVDLIIHCAEVREVRKVDLLLVELFTVEARELDVVQGPIKLDALSCGDLPGSGQNDGWCQEVDGYQMSAHDQNAGE